MSWLKLYWRLTQPLGVLANPILSILEHRSKTPSVWRQRSGKFSKDLLKKAPFDLWMHGASVGEIQALNAIATKVLEKRPETNLLVSAFTCAGFEQAQKLLGNKASVIHLPLDFPQMSQSVAFAISPRIFCTIETELWPNLILALRGKGVRLLLLNGRISKGSFSSYQRVRFLFKEVLQCFDQICAISKADRDRFLQLGAQRDKLEVCGNAKYEDIIQKAKSDRDKIQFFLPNHVPVIVAGSIREKEYREIYFAIERLRSDGIKPFVILVPRHLYRLDEIEAFLKGRGEQVFKLSQILAAPDLLEKHNSCSILLVDRIGWLFQLYRYCNVAFVGGSLVPLGGQNLMEPAAWAKPVVFGPHVNNFREAADRLLDEGGGFVVQDRNQLYKALSTLLKDEKRQKMAGEKAQKALLALGQGAATRQAQRVLDYLDTTSKK